MAVRHCQVLSIFRRLSKLSLTLLTVVSDCVRFYAAALRSRTALAAENLFLRKQLALFQEREKKEIVARLSVEESVSSISWHLLPPSGEHPSKADFINAEES